MAVILLPLWIYLRCISKGVRVNASKKCTLEKGLIHFLLFIPVFVAAILLPMDVLVSKGDVQNGLKSFGTSANTSFGSPGSSISTRPGWNSVSLLIPRFFDRLYDRDSQRNYYFHGPMFHLLYLQGIQEDGAESYCGKLCT